VLNVTQHNSSNVRISLENYDLSNQKIPWIPVTWITEKANIKFMRPIHFMHYPMMWFKPSDYDKGDAFIQYSEMIINVQHSGKFSKLNLLYYSYFYFPQYVLYNILKDAHVSINI